MELIQKRLSKKSCPMVHFVTQQLLEIVSTRTFRATVTIARRVQHKPLLLISTGKSRRLCCVISKQLFLSLYTNAIHVESHIKSYLRYGILISNCFSNSSKKNIRVLLSGMKKTSVNYIPLHCRFTYVNMLRSLRVNTNIHKKVFGIRPLWL